MTSVEKKQWPHQNEENFDKQYWIYDGATGSTFTRENEDVESINNPRQSHTPKSEFKSRSNSPFNHEFPSSNIKSQRSVQEYCDVISKYQLKDIQHILDDLDDSKKLIDAFQNYQIRGEYFTLDDIKESEHAKIKRYKDGVYMGEMINDKRHGMGILIYKDGHFYEGEWENDLKHGNGFEITASGGIYNGHFWNGKPEGTGTYKWITGEIYEGEWKNGLKHGSGMWKGTKGESYLGEWKFGKQEGHGVFVWRNGDKYEGEFKGYLKHGYGSEKFGNGDLYVGNYNNGKPHGYGEYYWSNGSLYKGFFRNGLRHGKGIWRSLIENGDEYDGEWVNDKRCGQGTFKWQSGNYYIGEFFDDTRQGHGTMHWIDGSYYKGMWERGIQHGEGELIVPGKPSKVGMFQNNIFLGSLSNSMEFSINDDRAPLSINPKQIVSTPKLNKDSSNLSGNNQQNKLDSTRTQILKQKLTPSGSSGITNTTHSQTSLNTNSDQFLNKSFDQKHSSNDKRRPVNIKPRSRSQIHSTNQTQENSKELSFISEVNEVTPRNYKEKRTLTEHSIRLPDIKVSPRLYDNEKNLKVPQHCLLTHVELLRWRAVQKRLQNLDMKYYRDLSKPEVCARIRKLINAPIWRPSNKLKIEKGRSEILPMMPYGVSKS